MERLNEDIALLLFYKPASEELATSSPGPGLPVVTTVPQTLELLPNSNNTVMTMTPRAVSHCYKIIYSTGVNGYGVPGGETYGEMTAHHQNVSHSCLYLPIVLDHLYKLIHFCV